MPPVDKNNHEVAVIAAHGDSMVLRMMPRRRHTVVDGGVVPPTFDHFVYRAGTATRPPSLTLLPGLRFPRKYRSPRFLLDEDTGTMMIDRTWLTSLFFVSSGASGSSSVQCPSLMKKARS
jgi:hypothetical protein